MLLPSYRFGPCIHQVARVEKYQTVRLDGNRYGVPRRCEFRSATINGYVDRIEIPR